MQCQKDLTLGEQGKEEVKRACQIVGIQPSDISAQNIGKSVVDIVSRQQNASEIVIKAQILIYSVRTDHGSVAERVQSAADHDGKKNCRQCYRCQQIRKPRPFKQAYFILMMTSAVFGSLVFAPCSHISHSEIPPRYLTSLMCTIFFAYRKNRRDRFPIFEIANRPDAISYSRKRTPVWE